MAAPGPHDALSRRPVLGWMSGLLLAGAPAACTFWPAPATPMPVRRVAGRCAGRERCVLLPGAGSRAEDFVLEGFVEDLQRAAPACEAWLAEAHLGYFVEGQLLPRLREDVVQPAGRGAGKPWLVGISLGGLAALAYAMRHGDEIAGVLALAPYLGRRELMRDISAAGGPVAWARQPAPAAGTQEPHAALEDALWRWLAGDGGPAGESASPRAPRPPIHLGYGRHDRFADAHRALQALLPPERTDIVDGGHDWPPWRALWQRWLQRGHLAAEGCGGRA